MLFYMVYAFCYLCQFMLNGGARYLFGPVKFIHLKDMP